jgi:hypothetical protein
MSITVVVAVAAATAKTVARLLANNFGAVAGYLRDNS